MVYVYTRARARVPTCIKVEFRLDLRADFSAVLKLIRLDQKHLIFWERFQ